MCHSHGTYFTYVIVCLYKYMQKTNKLGYSYLRTSALRDFNVLKESIRSLQVKLSYRWEKAPQWLAVVVQGNSDMLRHPSEVYTTSESSPVKRKLTVLVRNVVSLFVLRLAFICHTAWRSTNMETFGWRTWPCTRSLKHIALQHVSVNIGLLKDLFILLRR